MKQRDIKQKRRCKATLQNQSERQSALKIASVALVSLILTACSTNSKPFEIDYQAIKCAGLERGSISRDDVLTLETKKWVVRHMIYYDNNCGDGNMK